MSKARFFLTNDVNISAKRALATNVKKFKENRDRITLIYSIIRWGKKINIYQKKNMNTRKKRKTSIKL